MTTVRRAGVAAALAATPFALAWRFAHVYRVRAGFPVPHPPRVDPGALGMPFETLDVLSRDLRLPAWFIPARDGRPGPGIVLVHGWESARDRTLPLAQVLHAIGLHVLAIDVRGHGANPPESLPVSAGEFGLDTLAAVRALLERPEVTVAAVHGHSMGGIGAILAAAAEPRVAALAATSSPADPYRLTRQTFRLARLPIPNPIAYPLAWWTTRVFLQPRGHRVHDISASRAIARYRGPVLLLHGDADLVVPVAHLARLEAAARGARAAEADAAPVESLVIPGGPHSWLYEFPAYRERIARFLSQALGGPLPPEEAADIARAVPAVRLPDADQSLTAVVAEPGGLRSLAQIASPRAATSRQPGRETRGGLPDEAAPVSIDGLDTDPHANPDTAA